MGKRTCRRGDGERITCVTGSERKQYVVWYRGEGRSAIVAFGSDVHADRLRVTSTSDVYGLTSWLTIDNVTLADQTLYTCQRSGLGARHLAFRLVVDGGFHV